MLPQVELELVEWALEELVDHRWAVVTVGQREGLEIVPGAWCYPVVLGLVRMSANEAGWIRHAECADGSGVGEERVVHALRDKTVPEGLVEVGWRWKLESSRDLEGCQIFWNSGGGVEVRGLSGGGGENGIGGGGASTDEEAVEGAPRFQDGDG